jgi:hypothetical protein
VSNFAGTAIAAYVAAGFEQVDSSHWWAKAIDK